MSEQTPDTGTDVLDPAVARRLKRDPSGLVAAVVQQHDTLEVLMLGWMTTRPCAAPSRRAA